MSGEDTRKQAYETAKPPVLPEERPATFSHSQEYADDLRKIASCSSLRGCGISGSEPGPNRCEGPLSIHCHVCCGEQTYSMVVDSCGECYDLVRAAVPPKKIASSSYSIELSLGQISHNDTILLDHAKGACTEICCDGDQVEYETRLLSFVGPFLSVSDLVSDAIAGGNPYHEEKWYTFDLSQKKEAKILDVVEENSLVHAIMNDAWILKNLPEKREEFHRLKRLEDLKIYLSKELELNPEESFHSFAFFSYDEKRHFTALRLGLKYPLTGMSPNRVIVLGLWVKVLDSQKRHFSAAQGKSGLFMSTEGVDRVIE